MRVVGVHDAAHHQACQPVADHAPPQIVPRGYGGKGTRVVGETGGVVQPRGLDDLVQVAVHSVDAIVEPPRGTQLEGGIVARQRGQLAGVGCVIQREQDQGQPGVVSVLVQQGPQVVGKLGALRDVASHVRAKAPVNRLVVVTHRPHVYLHHQAVLDAHPGELHQHVRPEALRVVGRGLAPQCALKDRLHLRGWQLRRVGGLGVVVAGPGCQQPKVVTPLLQGLEVGWIGLDVGARDLAQQAHTLSPARRQQLDHVVGPEGRPDVAPPPRIADGPVIAQGIGRHVGGA